LASVRAYSEKYAKVIDNMKFDETFIVPFVREHLGDQAVAEVRKTWEEGIKPVPEGASFEKKYEVAYANWIWLAKNIYPFIRKQMGEDGLKKFERAEVEPSSVYVKNHRVDKEKCQRAFSSGTAFGMTAKQMAYELQWLTPYSVPELTHTKAVLDIPRCKILDFPDTEDICIVGCQSTYPQWVAEQFKVNMKFDRRGNSCTGTLSPLGK
jgi:hypothetical protein